MVLQVLPPFAKNDIKVQLRPCVYYLLLGKHDFIHFFGGIWREELLNKRPTYSKNIEALSELLPNTPILAINIREL